MQSNEVENERGLQNMAKSSEIAGLPESDEAHAMETTSIPAEMVRSSGSVESLNTIQNVETVETVETPETAETAETPGVARVFEVFPTGHPAQIAEPVATAEMSESEGMSEASGHQGLQNRKVFSFVRRSARLDDRLQRAKTMYSSQYLLDMNKAPGSLIVAEGFVLDAEYVLRIWGNTNPLVIEIGSGQGENIVAAAASNPDKNFLAIEVYEPGAAHTMLLAGKLDLRNIRIAQVNAPDLFDAIDSAVVSEVWTFFPDPWPKMRHHKRRIIQPSLALAIHDALVPSGKWRIATDIEDYALHVHEIMDERADFANLGQVNVSLPIEHVGKGNAGDAHNLPHADFVESERFEGRILTNFEKKGLAAGRRIHDFTYQKQD